MKIELSEYDLEKKGIYVSEIVKEYKKQVNEYSIMFGDYELIFIPETSNDISSFCEKFMNNFISPENQPKMKVILKKEREIQREGFYSYREFHKDTVEGKYDEILSIHIDAKENKEYDIYFLPEPNENLMQCFDKIFHRKI